MATTDGAINVADFASLRLRTVVDPVAPANAAAGPVTFSVALTDANGATATVSLPTTLPFPPPGTYEGDGFHWWYQGMARITTSLLEATYGERSDLDILDAGCGTGGAAAYLRRFGRYTGIDFSPLALGFCRQRGLARVSQASVLGLPFRAGRFDLVTSFDVLYHRAVADVGMALREFARVLRPGGRVLLRLPAYDRLRGRHDEVIHTARRFSADGIGRALDEAGFAVERLTYANTSLFPLAAVKRAVEGVRQTADGESDVRPTAGPVNTLLTGVLEAEGRWLRAHDLPFGLTVVALARRA